MHRNFRNITTNISCAYPRLLWKIPLLYKTISTPFVVLRATGRVWTLLEPCPPVARDTKCSEPEKNLAMNERVCVTWDRQTQAGPTSFAEEGGTVVRSKPYCHNNTGGSFVSISYAGHAGRSYLVPFCWVAIWPQPGMQKDSKQIQACIPRSTDDAESKLKMPRFFQAFLHLTSASSELSKWLRLTIN